MQLPWRKRRWNTFEGKRKLRATEDLNPWLKRNKVNLLALPWRRQIRVRRRSSSQVRKLFADNPIKKWKYNQIGIYYNPLTYCSDSEEETAVTVLVIGHLHFRDLWAIGPSSGDVTSWRGKSARFRRVAWRLVDWMNIIHWRIGRPLIDFTVLWMGFLVGVFWWLLLDKIRAAEPSSMAGGVSDEGIGLFSSRRHVNSFVFNRDGGVFMTNSIVTATLFLWRRVVVCHVGLAPFAQLAQSLLLPFPLRSQQVAEYV